MNEPVKQFRELYCERNGIAAQHFERLLLRRGLHLRARLVYWLLARFANYREADLDFVRSVGSSTTQSGFDNAAFYFHSHPHNRWFLRRVLRLRVSSRRVKAVFDREMKTSNSLPPCNSEMESQ